MSQQIRCIRLLRSCVLGFLNLELTAVSKADDGLFRLHFDSLRLCRCEPPLRQLACLRQASIVIAAGR